MIDIVLNSGKPVTGVIGDTLNEMRYIIATVYIHGVVFSKNWLAVRCPQSIIMVGSSLSFAYLTSGH